VLTELTWGRIQKAGRYLPIILLLLLALFMRLFRIQAMSLSNDELSMIWRSYAQPSWHDMIVNGVLTDGHPPLGHIIVRYWLMLFGDSVLSIRLPFILAGVGGLYFMYRTGLLWFGNAPALLSVALLSALSYSIYYHQIARPYALGFLWVQAAAYYWTQFLFGDKFEKKYGYLALWAIMAVCSCYTHYFSMMAVAIMGFTGLFFLNKQNYRAYLLSGCVILLCLLPGLAIFKKQLSYNGLDWLSPPGHNWLWAYFATALNNSLLLYITLATFLLVSIGIGLVKGKLLFNKFQCIGVLWFFLSFLIGYLKSVYSKPVLQGSCLVFTFPFLVLVFFSFWADSFPLRSTYFCVFALVAIACYDTACRSNYYHTEHHGEFKGLAEQMALMTDEHGPDMLRITNVYCTYYWDYYWVGRLHRPEKIALYTLDPDDDITQMDSLLLHSGAKYVAYAWSNKYTPDTVFKLIAHYYPHLLQDPAHFNSGIRLYTK
jgi:4-amino-4-deoxy-L-arabinose transferase-like glycosyltransferase